jgi:hypothetical protein
MDEVKPGTVYIVDLFTSGADFRPSRGKRVIDAADFIIYTGLGPGQQVLLD